MKDTRARRIYGDIIDLPHHQSSRHPHMSLYDRAAQFAPFAALTGYGDMVAEEARLTEGKPELSEDEREQLSSDATMVISTPEGTTAPEEAVR